MGVAQLLLERRGHAHRRQRLLPPRGLGLGLLRAGGEVRPRAKRDLGLAVGEPAQDAAGDVALVLALAAVLVLNGTLLQNIARQ